MDSADTRRACDDVSSVAEHPHAVHPHVHSDHRALLYYINISRKKSVARQNRKIAKAVPHVTSEVMINRFQEAYVPTQ